MSRLTQRTAGTGTGKRVAAIVLPQLACELARPLHMASGREHPAPLAVMIEDGAPGSSGQPERPLATDLLVAVDERAWRYGVRPGQSVAEAAAFVAKLNVVRVFRSEIARALSEVAEIALGFGTTAAMQLERDRASAEADPVRTSSSYPGGAGAGPADTVWLDVTGCGRAMGGEDLLCEDLRQRVQQLGHRARVVIADGPRMAQALARWSRTAGPVAVGQGAQALAELPVVALPLESGLITWLGKLGILRIDDLACLDRAKLAARLGSRAQDVIGLLEGRDHVPLLPYQPPRLIVEQAYLERELDGIEPLLFIIRGLTSRAALRLGARGEACSRIGLDLGYDRAIARLRELERQVQLELALPVPLCAEEDLLRTVRAKLEQLALDAPVISIRLTLDALTPAPHSQLDLSQRSGVCPNALPTLLAELSAWLGPERIGVLRLLDSHRPEARSKLAPVDLARRSARPRPGQTRTRPSPPTETDTQSPEPVAISLPEPTRILPEPIFVGQLQTGTLIPADRSLYLIDRLRLVARIDRVEWWTNTPVSRDYARSWLRTGTERNNQYEHSEAWVFVDRGSKRGFVHGWYD